MGRTLLLTGRPGIGKTTVIKAVARGLGKAAGGFYTEEIRGPGGRKGFRLLTLDGSETVMAHVDLRGQGRPRVGRYGVDVEAVECLGVAALRRAMSEGQLVVVDEIGKMELFCGPFKDAVLQAVGGPHAVVATVMASPNPWVDSLKMMPQVEMWEVTVKNRDWLPDRVIHWVAAKASRAPSRA
jgi:nucleoside-triphosphatase THEP1